MLAAPYAGQYVGLYGEVSIDGSDGATYRIHVEVTRPSAVNVGTQRELRLDVTRCVKARCVEIGHHLKGLLPEELTIADDYRSGRLQTTFAGRTLNAEWRDPSTGPLPQVNGLSASGVGVSGLPHPGVNPEVYREAYRLQMSLALGGSLVCPATEAIGFETTGADTVGRDLRETRTPEPLRLAAGLAAAARRTPRCTPPPKSAQPAASPAPSASASPSASPKPAGPLPLKRQIVEIRRTRKSGIAVLALAGRITAQGRPGFFTALDVYTSKSGGRSVPVPGLVDFGAASEPSTYGHGASRPLCPAMIQCGVSESGGELSFTLTVTDDTRTNDDWQGRTHYLLLEGTGFELESAAVGFSVKKRSGGFDRRTAAESDADGAHLSGVHVEAFRAASILGGRNGSVIVAQLPCEYTGGAGAALLSHDSDRSGIYVRPLTCGSEATGVNPESHLYAGAASEPGMWRLDGAVVGLTRTKTRLLVMDL